MAETGREQDSMSMRKIILEDGTEYVGQGFGSPEDKLLELVFNTSMAGYQEILTDPSYTDQAVVMTYPIIGNYGINEEDSESAHPSIGAMIVREYAAEPSNFRCSRTLGQFMAENNIAGVQGVDTRALTRRIRTFGSCKVLITGAEVSREQGLERLLAAELPHDQVRRVSTGKLLRYDSTTGENRCHVVAVDCGMKLNILRELRGMGCRVTVVPFDISPEELRSLQPDGVFLSNGPGDPEDVQETIGLLREIREEYPIFGICLGNQLLSLAYGAHTYKLKFGHRGGNHPVKNLRTGKLEITSQNHSYAVDGNSLPGTGLEITHINLLDNTVEGVCHAGDRAFGIQYHPESAPGPQDSSYLFTQFIQLMEGGSIHA